MNSRRQMILAVAGCFIMAALAIVIYRRDLPAQVFPRSPELDRSKPVPSRDEVVAAWRKRQDAVTSFHFTWTEQQAHPKGWIPNPRYTQHEWLDIPGLAADRTYTVSKSLSVDGSRMRYSFEIERKDETDDFRRSAAPDQVGRLGPGKHYTYTSVFDGQTGAVRLQSLRESPPATTIRTTANVDAQTLDTRPILMTFRPLDPQMGHVLIDRAVTNQMRTFHRGQSTFLLEERFDPSGWKSIFRIEPERDFLISQFLLPFEHKPILEMDIDYIQDPKWGWVPSAWRITQMLADGTKRQIVDAKVTGFSINAPMPIEVFRLK